MTCVPRSISVRAFRGANSNVSMRTESILSNKRRESDVSARRKREVSDRKIDVRFDLKHSTKHDEGSYQPQSGREEGACTHANL